MPADSTIGLIDIEEDDEGRLVQDSGGAWTDYMVYNRYIDDPHLYMSALTSPSGFQGDSCAFVQLAAPTLMLAAEWTASRWGTKPAIPEPAYSDPDWVFLGKTPETAMVPFGPDGVTPLYRISGTYFYGKRNPAASTFPDMVFPRPAWAEDDINRDVTEVPRQRGIIDGGLGGGGIGGAGGGRVALDTRLLTNGRG